MLITRILDYSRFSATELAVRFEPRFTELSDAERQILVDKMQKVLDRLFQDGIIGY